MKPVKVQFFDENGFVICEAIGKRAQIYYAAPEMLAGLRACITDAGAHCIGSGSVSALARRLASINISAEAAIAQVTEKTS